jgi:hypothetical protein
LHQGPPPGLGFLFLRFLPPRGLGKPALKFQSYFPGGLALAGEPSGELRLLNAKSLGKLRDSSSAGFAKALHLIKQGIKKRGFVCFHNLFIINLRI